MPETQDKIGFLAESNRNNTKRGGREIPDEPQDGKIGTLHKDDSNAKPKGGSLPGDNTIVGFRGGVGDAPSARRVNDHIRKIADEY